MEKLDAEWDDMDKKATNHMHMMKDIERVMISSGWMNMNQGTSLTACREELQQDDCYSRSNSDGKHFCNRKRRVLLLQGQPGTER